MAFVTRVGLSGWPDEGDTLEVYPAGATRIPANLISDLTDYEGGSSIANPYIIPPQDFIHVTTPAFTRVDIWWPEGLSGSGRYIVENAIIRSINSYKDTISFELATNPKKVYWVYGDSSDGGNNPDTETQAAITALQVAGVPASNIRWLYEISSTQFAVNPMNSAVTADNIDLALGSSVFTIDDVAAAALFDGPLTITQASGVLEVDETVSAVAIDNVVIVDTSGGGNLVVNAMLSQTFGDNVSLSLAGGSLSPDAMDSSVAQDAVTLVLSGGTFSVAAMTSSLDLETPTMILGESPPALSTATIGTDGTTLTLVFDESVTVGAGGNGGFNVDASTGGNDITCTYSSGSGSTTLVYTLGTTVTSGETANLDYTQPGNGIEATTGGLDVPTFSDASVTNNSVQTPTGGTYGPSSLTSGLNRYSGAIGASWAATWSGSGPTNTPGVPVNQSRFLVDWDIEFWYCGRIMLSIDCTAPAWDDISQGATVTPGTGEFAFSVASLNGEGACTAVLLRATGTDNMNQYTQGSLGTVSVPGTGRRTINLNTTFNSYINAELAKAPASRGTLYFCLCEANYDGAADGASAGDPYYAPFKTKIDIFSPAYAVTNDRPALTFDWTV